MKIYPWLVAMSLISFITLANEDTKKRPSIYTGSEVKSVQIEKHGYLLVSYTNKRGKHDHVKCARYSNNRVMVPTRKSETALMKPICEAGLNYYLTSPYSDHDVIGAYIANEEDIYIYVSDRVGGVKKIKCTTFTDGKIKLTASGSAHKSKESCTRAVLSLEDKKWKYNRDLPKDMKVVSDYVDYYKVLYKNRITNTLLMEDKFTKQSCQVTVRMIPLTDNTFEAEVLRLRGSDDLCNVLRSSIDSLGLFKKPESEFLTRMLKQLVLDFSY